MNKQWSMHILALTLSFIFPVVSMSSNLDGFEQKFFFQYWKIERKQETVNWFRQNSFPIFFQYELVDNIMVSASRSMATMKSNDQTLRGLGDTKVKFNYQSPTGYFRASAGVSLPLGKNILKEGEIELANKLYHEIFEVDVARLGQGLNLEGALIGAVTLKSILLSAGMNYQRTGGYHIIKNTFSYNPGDQIQFLLGGQIDKHRITCRNTLIYRNHGVDQIGGIKSFEQGSELEWHSSLMVNVLKTQINFFLDHRWRKPSPSVTEFNFQMDNARRNARKLGFELQYPMMPTLTISARFADYYIASDELGQGRSSAQQISMGSRFQITDYTKLRLEGRFSIGQMENDTLKLTGRTYLAVLQASI
jgi:hypothetical protein